MFIRTARRGKDDENRSFFTGDVKNISRDNNELRLGLEFHNIVSDLRDIILHYITAIKEISGLCRPF